jgi:DNA-binding CsgD family transcriptional regulator
LIDWETADTQLVFHSEAVALAIEVGDPDLVVDTKSMILASLAKLGEITEIEVLLGELEALAAGLRRPHISNVLIGYRTALAILRGDWQNAIRHAHESVRQASLQGVVGLEGRLGFQMFAIYKARGELGRVGASLQRILTSGDNSKLWLPGLILLHCELGQYDQARAALERLGPISALPQDDLQIISLVYLAEACRQLQDRCRIAEIYDRLYPNRERMVNLPVAVMLGAISGYLAILAAVLHKPQQARELFEHAMEFNRRIGAAPELARCCVEYAAFLTRSEYDADRRRVRSLLAEATPIAKSLELRPVLAGIDDLQSLSGPDQLTRREIDILTRIAAGASNKKIAADLGISHSTVATHVRSILAKSGATNRTEAVRFARRAGLLSAP